MSGLRRRDDLGQRGPPFVEIQGRLYLNLAFDLPPLGRDVRHAVAAAVAPDVEPDKMLVLRELTPREAKLLDERRQDAELEAWAKIVA